MWRIRSFSMDVWHFLDQQVAYFLRLAGIEIFTEENKRYDCSLRSVRFCIWYEPDEDNTLH
jgi:hypothetical protein